MRASVTILSFNRCLYLKKCVDALITSFINRQNFELIIVDNGSEDESPDYIRFLLENNIIDKAIFFSENQGISKGYNSGFAISDPSSDYLIKLDCDVIVHHSGWLEEMHAIFSDHQEVGLLMLYQENHPIMPHCPRTNLGGRTLISLEEIIVGSSCFTIPKNTLDTLGFFFEDHDLLLFYDDIDYYIRLSLSGKKAFYLLSHTSSYQVDLDETVYKVYDEKKEVHYKLMDEMHKTLAQNYRNKSLPIKKTYQRMDSLRIDMGEQKSINI